MHGELERCMQGFVRETSGTEDHLEVPGLHVREILRHIDHVVQDRDKRRPLVNAVIQLLVP